MPLWMGVLSTAGALSVGLHHIIAMARIPTYDGNLNCGSAPWLLGWSILGDAGLTTAGAF